MPYLEKNYKVSNVRYVNKDFAELKSTLIEYAKTYFPDTYRDFNETSPGMMLIEMSAYVGDVLSFYIDQQYKEMMAPLAEERRNMVNIANMLGYKVKPTAPAYVDVKVTQTVNADTSDINNIKPDYGDSMIIDKGMKISSTSDSSILFETLEPVDFTITSSKYKPEVDQVNSDTGVVTKYKLTRYTKAVSAETKTKTFKIGSPQKFLKLTIPDKNVIDIVSVEDTANNITWYEVDYLAQDKVPSELHYTDDSSRQDGDGNFSAYYFPDFNGTSDGTVLTVPVPFSLEYKKASKRFIVEINDDNTTSLVFGNGILRNGEIVDSEFLQLEQVGIVIPGEPSDLISDPVDPFSGDFNSTLGEAPSNTTLTVTYRVGGGVNSNVQSGQLETISSKTLLGGTNDSGKNLTVTNEIPAIGGSSGQTVEEIRKNAMAFFATQNRCVTKEDFEARVLTMPARYGEISKVYAQRNLIDGHQIESNGLPVVELYILSYDDGKNLITLPVMDIDTDGTVNPDEIVHPLKVNLKNYLDQFRMVTDEVIIKNGKIVNFGVAFSVVAHKSVNKQDVKLRCIELIKDYFKIEKMQFHQAIYTSDLEYELMGVDGVRSIDFVEITQNFNDLVLGNLGSIQNTGVIWSWNNQTTPADGDDYYGWEYNFKQFYESTSPTGVGTILPSFDPSVFELKFPDYNIKGIVK